MNGLARFSLAVAITFLPPSLSLPAGPHKAVTIPFELVNKNIFIRVAVNRSGPVWFLLDTGVKPAIVNLSTANTLGLDLGDPVQVGGAGKDLITGYLLKSGTFHVVGVEAFSQPLFIAIPLDELANSSGHEIAGILGFEFISHFVVRIDYVRQTITLEDPSGYQYDGDGEILPIAFNAASHPVVHAQVVDGSRPPVDGAFVVDTGSGAALIFNSSFVDREDFLRPGRLTVPLLAGRGLGGGLTGSLGRITRVTIGRFSIDDPLAVFSRATAGAFASTEAQGNIGAAILEKFTVILDYARTRMILEPNARFAQRMPYNWTGLSLGSDGNDYRRFRVDAVADNSPASESQIQVGDILEGIDGRSAAEHTLSEWREILNLARECHLRLTRGERRVEVTLVPRRLL